MDTFSSVMRFLAGGSLSLFESRPPLLSLVPISVAVGVGMLWVFRRVSDQASIRDTKRRLTAHLYELRLFADEPRLIWRAQKELLLGNLRYLALMLRPAVILTIPMVLLLLHLDAFYGRSPLSVGEAAIVTAQMNGPLDAQASPPGLEAPDGIVIETPPVRVLRERQISWRVRPSRSVSGSLRIVFPDAAYEKSIEAGQGPKYLSGRRVHSLLDQLWHPAEKRLPDGPIEWIEVRYPPAEVDLLGAEFHWLVWFFVISLASAWVFRKRFGVTL